LIVINRDIFANKVNVDILMRNLFNLLGRSSDSAFLTGGSSGEQQ